MSSKRGSAKKPRGELRRPITPLVGRAVAEQRRLRPGRPIRRLDEFLAFLAELEALFGPIEKPARIPDGGKVFRL
jgi:hypothetical protein